MTCMFRLSCALLDLLAVSVVRLHDLVCAHKVTKKQLTAKAVRGNRRRCLSGWVWGGLAGSCVSRFFVQILPQCRFTGSWTWLINCRYTFFGVMESVAGDETQTDTHTHTHTGTHTHTRTHTDVHVWSCSQRPAVLLSRDPEDEKHRTKRKTDRDTDHLTGGFFDQQGYVCFLDGQLQIRPLVLVSSYLFFEGSSAFVCMPFGAWYTCALRVCGSKLCNEKGKLYFHRPKFISNNLRYAGRKMTWACNTCVYMSLTCADTAALLLVPETLTCELCVLKITG